MSPHETGVENEDAIIAAMDAHDATSPSGPDPAPVQAPAGESNVKRRVTHTRQASVDTHQESQNELQFQHQYAASPLPAATIPAQKKKKSITISQKHLPEDRRLPGSIDSRLSPPSALSPEEAFTAQVVPELDLPKDDVHAAHPHDEIGVPHPRERPRRAGPRRKSLRGLMSPNQQPHAMDFMVGEEEAPPYYAPAPPSIIYQGGPLHHDRIRSPFHSPLVDEMGVEGAFNGRYLPPPPPGPNYRPFSGSRLGSPEIPFHPEGGGFFPRPHASSPFPPELPMLAALPPPQRQLTGYQLLAAKLSGDVPGPRLAPIYRRFEALHHRLLLNLQDELTQLEAQLDDFDAQDAHHGMYPGNGRPGSRRSERNNPRDTNWARNEVLSQIAQKLYQYNQALASFKETQDLGEPTASEAFGYRHYLENFIPEMLEEGNFLDAPDLVSLARRKSTSAEMMMDDPLGPRPRSVGNAGFPPGSPAPPSDVGSYRSSARRSHVRATPAPQAGPSATAQSRPRTHSHLQSQPQPQAQALSQSQSQSPTPLVHLVLILTTVTLVPILTFSVIRGFVGRMTVVLLVSLGSAAAALQSGHLTDGLLQGRKSMDVVVCVGAYGAAMAIIAGTAS